MMKEVKKSSIKTAEYMAQIRTLNLLNVSYSDNNSSIKQRMEHLSNLWRDTPNYVNRLHQIREWLLLQPLSIVLHFYIYSKRAHIFSILFVLLLFYCVHP
jgi:glucosamine 6-phosphate synthetase-like amidotransferase/phosphosugar isomerase protein